MTAPENGQILMTSSVVVTAHHLSANVGDEVLILHLETDGYYRLDKVGAQIWKLLERPILVSEIADALSRQYAIPRDRLEADVVELLGELEKRGLIQIFGDQPQA
jgi:hypothetical protein